MTDELFAAEEAVAAAAERRLAADWGAGAEERREYAELLAAYRKLMKTTRRLMRLSDRNERELNTLAARERHAVEELERKNNALESLSSKLAKYLSPQVYASIFSGRQEVKLASRRRKLTVCFADIAGFTEMTDRVESEDLTRMLNHYLTEMSRVALGHGATIDKYIGDAIMTFFGDPDSRGVRQDALACVEMAVAMQDCVRDLRDEWYEAGAAKPLSCRIGIATGYCTVGNFGSEDRMDYTIIGSTVNLASRLENESEAGGILIARETYLQVQDAMCCEELGRVRVPGIAYPIAAYKVVGRREDVDPHSGMVRKRLPNLELSANLEAMDADERRAAAAALENALWYLARLERPARERDAADGEAAGR